MTRREALLAFGVGFTGFAAEMDSRRIRLYRVPNDGIQPQAAFDHSGILHVVYYSGDAHRGDVFYTQSKDGGASFSPALRVNTRGSAIAAGTIRGPQFALGKVGRVHVAWNGSTNTGPINPDSGQPGAPMLYARINDAGNAFEPERNLMLHSFGLDGGGSIAADDKGDVYVTWHGVAQSEAKGSPPGRPGARSTGPASMETKPTSRLAPQVTEMGESTLVLP